jgi:hypothetical protein
VKQFKPNIGFDALVPDIVIVVSDVRLAKAFAEILVIPELTVIDVTVEVSVELTPSPMVKILIIPSVVGIVIELIVVVVNLVIAVRVVPDKSKINV